MMRERGFNLINKVMDRLVQALGLIVIMGCIYMIIRFVVEVIL
jgi:hypothetical protein